jgi:hypothetical protein
MVKAKTKDEVTRIAAIASEYGQDSHIILPRSFLGQRVFAILKSDYDKVRQREQRENTRTIGTFARSLINQEKKRKEKRTQTIDKFASIVARSVMKQK